MKLETGSTVFVFDLDDTLYKEADYHSSGVLAVISKVASLYGVDPKPLLQKGILDSEKDLWGCLCRGLKLPESVKESLLWEYRLHAPSIFLDKLTKDTLFWLQEHAAGLAILTDGRAITQRLKIAALGLSHLPIYISEEHDSLKPEPARFLKIQEGAYGKRFVYIGDNPAKDFLAPNQLDWTTIGLRGDTRNIHSQDVSGLNENYLPHTWIDTIGDLRALCY